MVILARRLWLFRRVFIIDLGLEVPFGCQCEHCITIGIRASLTEVVQIIGRCTRDCEGKTHAQFTNLIPCPDAAQDDVSMAVNDFLKAISASLLMEQVMAPKWNFKTKVDDEDTPEKPKKPGEDGCQGRLG